jgi:hypothetical protein
METHTPHLPIDLADNEPILGCTNALVQRANKAKTERDICILESILVSAKIALQALIE